jgi:hypothetical protein
MKRCFHHRIYGIEKIWCHLLSETQTPCYVWALIPNYFNLLLKTGNVPIATVMRKLLTGYAVTFNRRYRRVGHLFQNRYKSILCQEDPYLLELVPRAISDCVFRSKVTTHSVLLLPPIPLHCDHRFRNIVTTCSA